MAAATPPDIDGKVTRFTSWHNHPEEQYAKRMRTLRQLCVDTEGSCRDQFFTVMGQVDDWEWEDLNPAKLDEDQHVSNRTQTVLKAFSLGQLVTYQSPRLALPLWDPMLLHQLEQRFGRLGGLRVPIPPMKD